MTRDEDFMELALKEAAKGVLKGQSPFGACIVKGGEVVACSHNTVWKDLDPTRHAEMNAIKVACKKLKTIDLKGCTIYSTTEPCPMCFSAVHWARISKIVYGASIADAERFGFNELRVSNKFLSSKQKKPVKLVKGVLKDEVLALFEAWKHAKGMKY